MFSTHRIPKKTWTIIKGKRYGAWADKQGPIGGGRGYKRVVKRGDVTVRTLEQLIDALAKAEKGQVIFIPGDVVIDFTEFAHIDKFVLNIPAGVTLASDRGLGKSLGALLESDTLATCPLLLIGGADVRITGLRIKGPDPKRRLEHHRRCVERAGPGDEGFNHKYYYALPVSEGIRCDHAGLEVDNCEIAGFSHGGIYLRDGDGHRIHHCFIHHCQFNGLGYGVCLDKGRVLIDHNLFDYNRHSIAGTGRPPGGYDALHNVELGASLSHCFDMHGGSDRKDGTDIAGAHLRIANNFFIPDARAIAIRGIPQQKAIIEGNWFRRDPGEPNIYTPGNTLIRNNAHGLKKPRVQIDDAAQK